MENRLAENFWRRSLRNNPREDSTWNEEIAFFYQKGISIEKLLQYLHFNKPDLPVFLDWIQQSAINNTDRQSSSDLVLSAEDLEFWNQNGYVVLKNAISDEDCDATRMAIWDFLQAHPEDSASWYKSHPSKYGMMVDFSNHPVLNKNRASSRIRKAFEQLYQSDKIYKSIDKVSFNAPVTDNHGFMGSDLHWDVSLKLPIPFRLQGLIYLSDCGEEEGCFKCVPGFHHRIEDWMGRLQPGANARETALQTLSPDAIAGKAGDMVIWHQALPHCASPNYGSMPRMVQYLTYLPEDYTASDEWI